MSIYAENTQVSSDKSRAEIDRILRRYGASQFMYGWREDGAMIAFMAHNRQIRFVIKLPNIHEFQQTPTGRERSDNQMQVEYEKAVRQKWRALALVIKAKLEAVESGISIFEDEFLANIVLPNNQTAGEFMRPQIEEAYQTRKMPKLLPDLGVNNS